MSQPDELPIGPPSRHRGKRVKRLVVLGTALALALLLGLFLYRHFFSNPTRLRSGTVYDAVTGKPIPGAEIVVTEHVEWKNYMPVREPNEYTTVTDTEGGFIIDIPEHWALKGYHVLVYTKDYVPTSIGVSPSPEAHGYMSLYSPLVRPKHWHHYHSLPEDMAIEIYPLSHASVHLRESWWEWYVRAWHEVK